MQGHCSLDRPFHYQLERGDDIFYPAIKGYFSLQYGLQLQGTEVVG